MRVCTSFHCYCNSVNLSVIEIKERRKRTSPFHSILRIELITAWFVPGNYVLVKNNQCIYLNTLEEKIKYTMTYSLYSIIRHLSQLLSFISSILSFSNIPLSQTSLYLKHLFISKIPLSLYPQLSSIPNISLSRLSSISKASLSRTKIIGLIRL